MRIQSSNRLLHSRTLPSGLEDKIGSQFARIILQLSNKLTASIFVLLWLFLYHSICGDFLLLILFVIYDTIRKHQWFICIIRLSELNVCLHTCILFKFLMNLDTISLLSLIQAYFDLHFLLHLQASEFLLLLGLPSSADSRW